MSQESYQAARAILRGYIPVWTLPVPNGWFLYHSIVWSWYRRVHASTNGIPHGNVFSRERWARMKWDEPCTDIQQDEQRWTIYMLVRVHTIYKHVYTYWNSCFMVYTMFKSRIYMYILYSHTCLYTYLFKSCSLMYIPGTYIECASSSLHVHRIQKQKVAWVWVRTHDLVHTHELP